MFFFVKIVLENLFVLISKASKNGRPGKSGVAFFIGVNDDLIGEMTGD
jgi:hypothetical protein